jgi:hypothetical protein
MINKTQTVVIIGSVVLLGVGAYIYFKPKATDKGAGSLADMGGAGETGGAGGAGDTNSGSSDSTDNTVTQTTDPVTNDPLKKPIVKTLTNTDILAVQRLRDEIIANMNRIRTYKKQSSRNAVQADINIQLNRLKTYGYSLDTTNNLIKIVSDDSGDDVYKYTGKAPQSKVLGVIKAVSPLGFLFR